MSRRQTVVLLVQPERDDRDMYAEYMKQADLLPILVSTAEEALTLAAAGVDIVVTGIGLNGSIDGIELVAKLRCDRGTRSIPIIMLTASAWQTERDRALLAGCDVFLPKPCLPDDLVREVRRLLASPKARAAAAVAGRRGPRAVADKAKRRA